MEQSHAERAGSNKTDGRRACRVPEDGDVAWVATEGGDIGLHPLEPRHEVLDAIGSRAVPAFATQLRVRHEAKRTEAIREADEDHALFREPGAVIHADGGGSAREATAVNPDDDGKLRRG